MTPDERPTRAPDAPPVFSPGPWSRGLLYSLCALGAIAYGHFSGQRRLDLLKGSILVTFAIVVGVVIALLQTWARRVADD